MLNIYKDQFEIPIFNYYESFRDISYLLKERKELNKAEKEYLLDKLIVIQDWFSKEISPNDYNNTMIEIVKAITLKWKILELKYFSDAFNVDEKRLKLIDLLSPENYDKFKKFCQKKYIPYRVYAADQKKDFDRKIKGYSLKIERIEVELEKNKTTGLFDYMALVTEASYQLGYRIDPKEFKLYEWVSVLKRLEKNGRGNKTDNK